MLKKVNVTKEEKEPKSTTTQMVDLKDYREVSLSSQVVEQEVTEEENVFLKLQEIFMSSNKEINEILSEEEKTSELYASALYASLKEYGLSDEVIRTELDNILTYSLTFTDLDDETWTRLFGNLVRTIGEEENVMDYYYPLAFYVHKGECELVHTKHEFDENRMTCATLEKMASEAICEVPYAEYVVEMIQSSGDAKINEQYMRIVNSGVNFDLALDELSSIYVLSQVPMCVDEDVWNQLFKNLLTTVDEYENVFSVYGDLASFVHALNCDYVHYIDEYGVNVCEGLRLEYK